MATVTFYEKPGCINNTRQKQMLVAAGHTVIAKNLLAELWQAETLKAFFAGLPVAKWFNYSAPAIKYGEVEPDKLDADTALALMLADPVLIRRPLMLVGEQRMAGFDATLVDAWLGLTEVDKPTDWETCPKTPEQSGCSHG